MKERRAILPVAGVWLVSTAAVGGLVYLNRRAKAVGPLMIGARTMQPQHASLWLRTGSAR